MLAATQIELVQTDGALQGLQAEWSELYAAAAPRNPFLSFDWTLACRKHHCPGSELFVLTVREAGRLAAVAPLRRDRQAGFRVLRFVGDGRSDYLGFLIRDGRADLQQAILDA
ncbi:MAG: hypothetical protein ACO1SX_12840, partial [Actinomycetota bacterium]